MRTDEIEVIFTPYPYDAVARGMAFLDEKAPGWRRHRPFALGEVRALYAQIMRAAGLRPWENGAAYLLGFDAVGAKAYGLLQQAWREELMRGPK